MQITEHMAIDIAPKDGVLDVTLKATGKLTHADYSVMVPMITQAIQSIPNVKVNMLLDATEFEGWELEAAWDDFKFGVEYKDTFLKIAIVGTKTWQEYLAKMGDWFMDGEVKFFYDLPQAQEWIK
jgi:hypothetical protein